MADLIHGLTPEQMETFKKMASVVFQPQMERIMSPEILPQAAAIFLENPNPQEFHKEMVTLLGLTEEGEGGTDDTAAFAGDGSAVTKKSRRPVDPIKKAAEKKVRETSRIVTSEAKKAMDTNYGACAQIVAQKGAIVAYLTPTPEKIDIAKSTVVNKEGTATTTLALKSVGPGAVKAIVVALPIEAIQQVRKYTSDTSADPNVCDVALANQPNQPMVLEIQTPEQFTDQLLAQESAGSINEAPQLWVPTSQKRYTPSTKQSSVIRYETIADLEGKVAARDSIASSPNSVVLQLSFKNTNGVINSVARARHTVRPKLQAPGNFIPARVFVTEPIKQTYTSEEAKERTVAFLGKYESAKFKQNTPLLDTLAANDTTVQVSLDPVSKSKIVVGCNFFTTNANLSKMQEPIGHWFNKDSNGDAEKVSPIGQQIVVRTSRKTKAGTLASSLAYKEIQAEQNAEGTAFVPNIDKDYPNIAAACKAYQVNLTVTDIVNYFQQSKVLRAKGSGSGRPKAVKPIGMAAFGVARTTKSDALKDALSALEA